MVWATAFSTECVNVQGIWVHWKKIDYFFFFQNATPICIWISNEVQCNSIADFYNIVCGVVCITSKPQSSPFPNDLPAVPLIAFAKTFSIKVFTLRSTKPVVVWIYCVPYIIESLKWQRAKTDNLSLLIVLVIPFSWLFCSLYFTAVCHSVVLQRVVADYYTDPWR